MGWKGTVRSFGAAYRAMERDAKRRQRELEREQKQYEKMLELEQAAYEVEVHNNNIDLIQSVHKECGEPVNWDSLADKSEPEKPKRQQKRVEKARIIEKSYKPGFIDKIFKREDKKRKKFKNLVVKAIKEDEANFEQNIEKFEKEYKAWNETVRLARLVVGGDPESKIRVISDLNPFSEISELGSTLSFKVLENSMLEATIKVHGVDVIPKEVKKLLKSGRLSVKKIPKGQFNELYQDYVCSCILRVANELFSILPDDLVIVTATDYLLNSKTGHQEESPIVSVLVSRYKIKSLNMDFIDPSDSMSNFVHNMSFKKTKGFDVVEPIKTDI